MRKLTVGVVSVLVLAANLQARADEQPRHYTCYADIVTQLQTWEQQHTPYAKVITVGTTVNNTAIKGIVISEGAANNSNNANKPDVIITGAIHAREWAAADHCLYMAESLLDKKTGVQWHFMEISG